MRQTATLVLCVSILGCSPAAPIGIERPAIIGGTRDTGDPAVVFLAKYDSSGAIVAGCTAFVVSERVAITAAHCFDDAMPDDRFKLFLGDDARPLLTSQPSGLIDVIEWKVSAEVPIPSLLATGDVGVMAIAGSFEVAPIPLVGPLDATVVGMPLRLVGYGRTIPEENDSAFRKHQVTVSVAALNRASLSIDDPEGDGSCRGDSGGPQLLMVDGKEYAAAVVSIRQSGVDGGVCRGLATGSRLDVWTEQFIAPFIAAHPVGLAEPDMGPVAEEPPTDDCGFTATRTHGAGAAGALVLLFVVAAALSSRRRAR